MEARTALRAACDHEPGSGVLELHAIMSQWYTRAARDHEPVSVVLEGHATMSQSVVCLSCMQPRASQF